MTNRKLASQLLYLFAGALEQAGALIESGQPLVETAAGCPHPKDQRTATTMGGKSWRCEECGHEELGA